MRIAGIIAFGIEKYKLLKTQIIPSLLKNYKLPNISASLCQQSFFQLSILSPFFASGSLCRGIVPAIQITCCRAIPQVKQDIGFLESRSAAGQIRQHSHIIGPMKLINQDNQHE
jgi:hypothetical protein